MATFGACPDRAFLERFLRGEGSSRSDTALTQHLTACPACLALLRALRPDGPALETLNLTSPPPSLAFATLDGPALAPHKAFPFLAPPQQPDELGRLANYRVLKQLGVGGMGWVFLAEDVHLRRPVALKVMLPHVAARPEAAHRFLREARLMAAIKNDHIVTIYQVGQHDDVPFLAMELLHGRSLHERLRDEAKVGLPQLLRIGKEMALGLAAAHARGLIHRDIKPANVWLEAPNDRVKILDFGLAREAESGDSLTPEGTVVGTPAYMAPEQARGEEVGPRGDLFSLGCVLYRLCTGRLPFEGPTVTAILMALATTRPPSVAKLRPDVPPGLARLIDRLLAADPAGRPPGASAVADELTALEAACAAATITGTSARRAPPRRRPWAALALLLLGVCALVAWIVLRMPTPRGTLVIETDDPTVEVLVRQNGAVIVDRTRKREIELKAGDYEIELAEKKNGLRLSTPTFRIVQDGRETVKVWLERPIVRPPVKEVNVDPDRRLAEWLVDHKCSFDGHLTDNGRIVRQVKVWQDIPKGPFRIGFVLLEDLADDQFKDFMDLATATTALASLEIMRAGKPFTAASLEEMTRLPSLSYLSLKLPEVRGRDFAVLARLPNLGRLNLDSMPGAGDEALATVKGFRGLRRFLLNVCDVTDAGTAHLAEMKQLTHLYINSPHLTDRSWKALGQMDSLTSLTLLESPGLTGAGIEQLQGLRLVELRLIAAGVKDESLRRLAGFKSLTLLRLERNAITNAGLVHLKGLTALRELNLKDTRVDAAGAHALHQALPSCRIEWNGPTLEPKGSAGALDRLDPARIPAANRRRWQPKELVAVLGDHRLQTWGGARDLTVSPDGKWLAVGTPGEFQLWEAATLRLHWDHHHDLTDRGLWSAAAFLPDGKHLFLLGKVWDLSGAEPQPVAELAPQLREHARACAARRKPLLAASYPDGVVRVFEFVGGGLRPRAELKAAEPGAEVDHLDRAPRVAFADPEGGRLATWDGKRFKVWDLRAKPLREIAAGDALGAAVSPDCRTLAVRGEEAVVLWDLRGPVPQPIPGGRVHSPHAKDPDVAFSADGKRLVVPTRGRTEVWSLPPREKPLSAVGVTGGPALSGDGKVLYLARRHGGPVRVFDADGNAWTERSPPPTQFGRFLFSSDGSLLATQPPHGSDSTSLWDLTGATPAERTLPDSVRAGVLLGWRSKALVLARDNRVWEWTGGEPRQLLDLGGPSARNGLFLTRDGGTLAVARDDKTVEFWDLGGAAPRKTQTLPYDRHSGHGYFSADGKLLALGGHECRSRLYVRDGAGWKHLWTCPGETHRGSIALTAAGDRLATLHFPNRITLWALEGAPRRLRDIETVPVPYEADFSPDGRFLAVTSGEQPCLRIHDTATGAERQSWTIPVGAEFVGWAPDGRHLAVRHFHGPIWILRLALN